MRFTKTVTLCCIALSVSLNAQVINESEFKKQQEVLQAEHMKRFEEKGYLDVFKSDKELKDNRYSNAAKLITEESKRGSAGAMQKYFGMEKGNSEAFFGVEKPGDKDYKAIFVSFEMQEAILLNIFREAARQGATVLFKGLGPSHENIMDALNQMRKYRSKIDTPPEAKFNVNLFEQYNIEQVPALIIKEGSKVSMVSGLSNMGYLQSEHNSREDDGFKDFGKKGPTMVVKERSILEEIKSRLDGLDMEKAKEQAVKNFWKKKGFSSLPRAKENSRHYIDPTVKTTSDITSPRGHKIAVAGQMTNPLDAGGAGLTIYIINPLDVAQVEWLSTQPMENHQGRVMLFFSELSQEKGWEHLNALRKQFNREFYQLPKLMIERFHIDGLPAKVETLMDKRVLEVKQFNITKAISDEN